ncbi:sensor histidine kinase [Clostridium sp. ZS2-4]|uniref:sensor histidine kinase n=1 Tax=Clostridium sp. ZS2-4 TaxID=2987703 RepID=UPI00227A6D48|nr:HAMP domain-containing sensor histidine kinase [Clostridium sp. ZS2-4]MCY6355924.1 HAMP domain-containing sensor histidine kinase [Clostridium sp. ZS2-4]
MVEELLDFSRIIDKRIKLNLTNINLAEFLNNIFKQMEPRAKRLGIGLELNILEDADEKIKGDTNRLKQVFINILDNAFKFTNKEGTVAIYVIKKAEFIEIAIKDSGIGIPKEHLSKVTEKFYKVDTKDGGNGIGLSLANELVQLHGGFLEIESEYGEGTTVIVKLPRIKDE